VKLRITSLLDTGEALKTVAGKQLQNMIGYLADFVSQISQMVRNGLTFEDNVNCQVKLVSLSHNVEQVVSSDKIVRGIITTRVFSGSVSISSMIWYYNNSSQLIVKATFSTDPSQAIDVNLILLF
jgi:hypothetical protein